MKDPIVYFHRNRVIGTRFSLSTEAKKKLNRKLRDENIQIAEERTREDLVDNFKESIQIQLTPAQIRRKLRGGKRGTEKR